MKKLNLTVTERLKAAHILNEFKGNLSNLAVILEDIKQFPLTSDELKKIDGKASLTADGRQNIMWNMDKEKDIEKEISIQSFTLDYLKSTIKTKSDKGEFNLGDEAIITLLAKLEK